MNIVHASIYGDIDRVRDLLDHGVDINTKNDDGNTALMFASSNNCTEMVRSLLNHGADPDIQNRYGWTALMCSSWRGHASVVQLLSDHGASPYIKDWHGKTAYILATINNVRDILRHTNRGYSMFQLRDRSREYMSDTYHDVIFV